MVQICFDKFDLLSPSRPIIRTTRLESSREEGGYIGSPLPSREGQSIGTALLVIVDTNLISIYCAIIILLPTSIFGFSN